MEKKNQSNCSVEVGDEKTMEKDGYVKSIHIRHGYEIKEHAVIKTKTKPFSIPGIAHNFNLSPALRRCEQICEIKASMANKESYRPALSTKSQNKKAQNNTTTEKMGKL